MKRFAISGMLLSLFLLVILVPSTPSADEQSKAVFVTKGKYDGNLGGLAGADAICQAESEDSSSVVPNGTYLAWLSDSVDSPSNRFTKSKVPYVLVDGTIIAENYKDLTDGSILHPINIEVTGVKLGIEYVWTGTQSDGTSIEEWLTCNKWAADPAADFNGMGGRTTFKNSIWSSRIARVPCSRKHRLWCFQQ